MSIGRAVGQAVGDPGASATGIGAAVGSLWRLVRTGLAPAPDVAINRSIGPHRRLGWLELDLGLVKAAARRLGGTVNDAVLTVVSGALDTSLRRQGVPVPREPLRAVVPVSVRTADEMGAGGNRVSLWLVALPLAERDARRRFARIHATTEELKRGGQAAGGTVVTEAANWAGGAVVEQAARLIGTARLYNLIVTNVPGPPMPLFLAGCRLAAVYPHLPLFEQQGIGIALLSYAGRLHVGVTADWNLGPLLDDLTVHLADAFVGLVRAAGLEPAPDAPVPTVGPVQLQQVAVGP
jgi:WS/DGAT/MGAT family acyltransferase